MAPQAAPGMRHVKTVMSGGHSIFGGFVSFRTVTVKEHVAEPLQLSITRQLTVVTPNGNTEPEGGLQISCFSGHPPVTTGAGYCQTILLEQVQSSRLSGQRMPRGMTWAWAEPHDSRKRPSRNKHAGRKQEVTFLIFMNGHSGFGIYRSIAGGLDFAAGGWPASDWESEAGLIVVLLLCSGEFMQADRNAHRNIIRCGPNLSSLQNDVPHTRVG